MPENAVCNRCHRPLTNPESIRRGYGPVCAKKVGLDGGGGSTSRYRDNPLRSPSTPLDDALILRRDDGTPRTNVPHRVENHSPDGFEWGYAGSGPADLALNVVENFIQRMDDIGTGETVECSEGEVDRLTWRLYPYFKAQFLASVPEEGTRIEAETIRDWIHSMTNNLDHE